MKGSDSGDALKVDPAGSQGACGKKREDEGWSGVPRLGREGVALSRVEMEEAAGEKVGMIPSGALLWTCQRLKRLSGIQVEISR